MIKLLVKTEDRKGEGGRMTEAIAFFGGLLTMGAIWFFVDTKYNSYLKGYADGLRDGTNELMKYFPRVR